MEKLTSCFLRFSKSERTKIPVNPMNLEEIQAAMMNNVLLKQEEDPEELMA